jgi:hypothetical protein
MVVLLTLGIYDVQAAVIDSNWIGGGNGYSWGDANNWNPNIVPDNNSESTFAVTIQASEDYIDISLKENRTINQLDCNSSNNYEIDLYKDTPYRIKLTLLDSNGLTNYGSLEIEGARGMAIVGNVTNRAGAELEFWGIVDIDNGNLRNFVNGTIQIGGDDLGVTDGNLDNSGTVIIDPESEFGVETLHNSGLIYIRGGQCETDAVFDNNSTGVIQGHGEIYSDQIILNKGCIIASAGSLTVTGEDSIINTGLLRNNPVSLLHIQPSEDVNNLGKIEANAGGGIAFNCNLINRANALIELFGGTLAATTITQPVDANFAGFGTISGNVVIESNGVIQITGPTNIVGDVNIAENATLEISDGQTLITGHTICDGTIHLIGGTVIFQGGCDCEDCTIINEAGVDRNHFDINTNGIENMEDFAEFADDWLWQASWYD